MRRRLGALISWFLLVAGHLVSGVVAASTPASAARPNEERREYLVVLREQAPVTIPGPLVRRPAAVFTALNAVTRRTQDPVLAELARRGVDARPLWVVNALRMWGTHEDARAVARLPGVRRVFADEPFPADLPEPELERGSCPSGGVEPHLSHVQADSLWAQGIDGTGIVVGLADTGVQWQHEALRDTYRGWNGSTATHDGNWFDTVRAAGTGGICGPASPEPCDDFGHGTHVAGLVVGRAGPDRFGVAPGARWIGCRAMDRGQGSTGRYLECLQFFLAPTDRDGNDPDPALAPHVVNTSWGCSVDEGCTPAEPDVLRLALENLRAAGVLVVASAGNSGPACSTVAEPPAIHEAVFTVGNTDFADQISVTSSRGPVTFDQSGRAKPDLVAPGIGICSSQAIDSYTSLSGTSMAAPIVAGLAALALQARPCLVGDPDGLEAALLAATVPRTSTQGCGGLDAEATPNHVYGSGAARAIAPPSEACNTVFSDGFETGSTSEWS